MILFFIARVKFFGKVLTEGAEWCIIIVKIKEKNKNENSKGRNHTNQI